MISLVNKIKTARQTALAVLEAVFSEGAYSNIALNQALLEVPLSSADKGLVTEIVYGTVARKITLEWLPYYSLCGCPFDGSGGL